MSTAYTIAYVSCIGLPPTFTKRAFPHWFVQWYHWPLLFDSNNNGRKLEEIVQFIRQYVFA